VAVEPSFEGTLSHPNEMVLSPVVYPGFSKVNNIKWSIMRQRQLYKVGRTSCDLCTSEKLQKTPPNFIRPPIFEVRN
jgi:hypothetical protein